MKYPILEIEGNLIFSKERQGLFNLRFYEEGKFRYWEV